MKFDFSVIVLTFNPDLEKMKNTLYSIVIQENVSFEVIVVDDGSKQNYRLELEQFFEECRFSNYKIIINETNQGTVKNFKSGLIVAEGRYVKSISPGDYLYDKDTLMGIKKFLSNGHYEFLFGKAAFYSKEEHGYKIHRRHSPTELSVYRKNNKRKIMRNYFLYQDYVLGASFVFELDLIKKGINQIEQYARYCEDTSALCMLADNKKFGFLDKYIIWYEYGTGISTTSNNKWKKIIFDENKKVLEMLAPKSKLIEKAYKYNYCGFTNRYLNIIRKIVLSPLFLKHGIIYVLNNRFGKEYLKADRLILEKIENHG